MNKKNITIIKSTCVPLQIDNIDTDQIIPSRFLKSTTRLGFGENLFRDWRYDEKNQAKKDFVLNDLKYQGEIFVAGQNFGSGSSREHAAWALKDYGFNAVISSSFADIFKNNALNNNLLPVQVKPLFLKKLFASIKKNSKTSVVINLPNQTISFDKLSEHFNISLYKKECFIKGIGDIDYLISLKENIKRFEKERKNDFSL